MSRLKYQMLLRSIPFSCSLKPCFPTNFRFSPFLYPPPYPFPKVLICKYSLSIISVHVFISFTPPPFIFLMFFSPSPSHNSFIPALTQANPIQYTLIRNYALRRVEPSPPLHTLHTRLLTAL